MKVLTSPQQVKNLRSTTGLQTIGFVPTMGALHSGHLSLIEQSKKENDITVVSVYLNETQFNDPKDLTNYPSNLAEDLEQLKELDVDWVFTPSYKDIYADDYRFRVLENQKSLELCGQDRPGHFDGVLTVVLKLFNIVTPNSAYFGEKDYQQLTLIQDMAKSFFLDVEVKACPTVRDEYGLALSSRNQKLSDDGLAKARFFANELKKEKNLEALKTKLTNSGIDVDYLVDKDNRRFGAVKIANVRLIDNVSI